MYSNDFKHKTEPEADKLHCETAQNAGNGLAWFKIFEMGECVGTGMFHRLIRQPMIRIDTVPKNVSNF